MDNSHSENRFYDPEVRFRCIMSLLKAIVWFSAAKVAGIEIVGVECILYATCSFLYTFDDTAASALLARMFICIMLVFDCESPVLAISTAAYFIYYSETFQTCADTILLKTVVVKVLSIAVNVTKYLYMYVTMCFIAFSYYDFFVRGKEDIFLFAATVVPLVQSCLCDITKDTIFVVLALVLYWGDRKLTRFQEEGLVVLHNMDYTLQ